MLTPGLEVSTGRRPIPSAFERLWDFIFELRTPHQQSKRDFPTSPKISKQIPE